MFLHPQILWLLLLPLLLAVWQLRKSADITFRHNFLATGLRFLALSLVIVALARPFQQSSESTRHIVAVIDCSPSMGTAAMDQVAAELKTLAGRDEVRLVIFGAHAREVALDDDVLADGGLASLRFSEPGSAVAEALELAATLCPDDAHGDIHLFTDGRETRGDLVSAAAGLGRRGLELTIHALGTPAPNPVLLRRLRAPAAAAVGEAVTITAEVESRYIGDAMFTVTNNRGEPVTSRNMPLQTGVQELSFQVRPEEAGLQSYQVSLDDTDQAVSAGLLVKQTVVGVFESAPEKPAGEALRDILGASADIKPLTLADLTGDGLDRIDVLTLADTPAAELPVEVQQKLRIWVENGGGLLVTGGRNAFGPGGYAKSELADMLPLRFPQKKELRDPSTSLAIIIDTSGSMGLEGVNLAKEVARLALKRLKPHDKGGIVEFHGAKRWAAPMQPASNSIAIQRALNRLSAGGGTVMMPALEEAYYGLLNVRTRTKHVLILTDGGVEQGAFESLLRRMADDGIHVSTVLVGPRAGSGFLSQLAGWGRGQFYTAPSRFKLPEVIVKQPSSSLLNPFVEKEVRLEPVLTSRLTQDLQLESAPMLRGYVKTEAKDTAELLLQSEINDPVLARWHYGLGRVAILTTQLGGDWAEDFLNWPAAPGMMANLTRQLRGVSPRQALDLAMDWSSAGLDLDIRALSLDPSLAATPLRIRVKDADSAPIATREIMPVRSHTWSARFENLPAGACLVEVLDVGGAQVLASGGLVVPLPNEFNRAAPDREKLTAAAQAANDFAAATDATARPTNTRELWPLCAALGLLSFILMILVRRLPAMSTPPRVTRAATTGLALLLTLATLALSPSAMGQEKEEAITLTPAEQQHIDDFIGMAPAEGRQKLKNHCRQLTQRYGDLRPLCDYLKTKEEDGKTRQLLVVAALADGNLDLAYTTLGTLLAEPEPDPWTLSEMSRVQEMRGETGPALLTLKRALEQTKEPTIRFVMLVRIAQLHYDAPQQDDARAAIREILAEPDFNQSEGRNYCARIAGLHGDFELVEELFTPIGEGRSLMRDRLYFGQILMHLEKPDKAREQFSGALKLATLQRDRRYALDRIVSAARQADNLPALMDEWLASEDILPEQLEILVGVLGGELDRAEDVLTLLERKGASTSTQKLIQSPSFQERMIMVAMETGKSELARRKYLDLIVRHPKKFHYHTSYVRLLLMDGEHTEAEAFFRKTIGTTETVGGLMELAANARDMALEDVAMEAATKAGAMGELAHVQTVLFEAELHRQHGEADKALEVLKKLEGEIGEDGELMMPLSDAYERYGYKADSIRLIQKAYELTNSEKLLEKLISLMESEQKYEQVFVLWRKLWETATEPMAIVQAQDRLLDIGSKNGKLADIAIELEERLDEGKLSDRELAMLLEIYTSVNDPVSAADILLDLSIQGDGDRVDLYLRMVQVYMECELFGRCNAVLRKLIKIDPDNRDDYLQSLALIALERKNDGDAVDVLQELAERSKDGVLRDSFSASVLNMIGKHMEAARIYRRALADNPDEVETWLLWGNALLAHDQKNRPQRGRSSTAPAGVGAKQATGMFRVLLEESAEDDMFILALDGLLNTRAPHPALQGALRRVNERIALKPHKMYLYRLAADLQEELRRPNEVRMVLEQGLVVAEDGRSIILRELIALAKAGRKQDEVIRQGRSLLNTAEHLPPNECLELGTLLLDKGHFSEADAAFQRVIADGDVMGVTRDIILRYENAGLYGRAGKLLRQLLVGNPFDVELLLRLGIMEEKKGNLAAAHKAYQQSLDLMIGRLPSLSLKVEGEGESTPTTRPRYVRTYNLDETKQYFELATQGLIMSARTPESRQQLLDTVRNRVRTELETLEADDAFAGTHAENPRLVQLTGLMRRLGFAFHRPEYFDPMDDDLLKRYPDDKGLLSSLKDQRGHWGLLLNAQEFLARNNNDGQDDTFLISPYLADHDKLAEILGKQPVNSGAAETILPLLAMCGHDDLVGTVLDGLDLKAMSQTGTTPLATAGLATGHPGLLRNTLFNALAMASRSSRIYDTSAIENQISTAWPILSDEDRNAVTRQFAKLVEKVTGSRKLHPRSFHHHLMCQVGRSGEIDLKDLGEYVKGNVNSQTSGSYAWATVTRWLQDKPEAERPGALKQLIESQDAKVRAIALTQLAMLLDDGDISDELETVFKELLKPESLSLLPKWSTELIFNGYQENRLTDHVRKLMADRADSGTQDGADKIQSLCKSEIAGFKSKSGGDIRMIFSYGDELRQVADQLSPGQLDRVLEDYIHSEQPIDMLISFILLRQAGREAEALTMLQRIDALSTDDPRTESVRAAMPRILSNCGWDAHAPPFLAAGADDPANRMKLHYQLHDSLALLGGNAGDPLASGARRMHAAMLMKDPAQFLQSTRIYWADTRHPGVYNDRATRYRMRTWPSRMAGAPGGLLGMKVNSSGTTLDDLASLEGSQDELSYWLSAMPTTTGHSFQAPACKSLAANVREQGLSEGLRNEIEAAAGRSLLNRVDIEAITAIAAEAPEQLPPSLTDQMGQLILFNRPSGPSRSVIYGGGQPSEAGKIAALARTCKALGIDHFAQSLSRWSVARDLQSKGSSRWLSDYLTSLPEDTRLDTLRTLLPHMGINDIRLDAGGEEASLFTALLDLGMESEAADLLDRYLRRLQLIDTHSASGYKFRSFYQARMSNGVSDHAGGALQDALTVALARLNRPDDYQRILTRRVLLKRMAQPQQKTTNRIMMVPGSSTSYRISGTRPGTNSAPADFTHSLPEPDQVDDINRYIDIHLELNTRLRDRGELSRENHVAQVCMLGEWCAERGLDDRAAKLLTLANELSTGMLTGRLWVADLHRLLGEEKQAIIIEHELLRHDLLPMSRVPAALTAAAAAEGQARADAIAYRIASYSNHPEVLPLALRHAQNEGLKDETRDLADRLRKVSTLFLPPGA